MGRTPSDEQLLRGTLQGRRDDFGMLMQRYYRLVYGIAFSHTGNAADAEDLSQESFLKAYRSLDTLRDIGRFRAWLTRIVRNECHNWLTRRKHEKALANTEQPGEEAVAFDVEKRELFEFLWREIDALDESSREILTVYYFHGKNTREVAQRLDISVSAAEKRLQRARQLLGDRLASRLDDALQPHRPGEDTAKRVSRAVIAVPVAWDGAKVAAMLGTVEAAPALTSVVLWVGVVAIIGTVVAMFYGDQMRRSLVLRDEPSPRGTAATDVTSPPIDTKPRTSSTETPNVGGAVQPPNIGDRPDFLVRVVEDNEERSPIENATVTLFAPTKRDLQAVSDVKGEAEFGEAPLGYTALAVEHPQYLPQRMRYTRFAHGGSFEVALKAGKSFRGTVVTAATGEPISDFVLELTHIEPPMVAPWRDGPVSFHDEDGEFTVWRVESAETLIVRAPGFARSDIFLRELSDWKDLTVSLDRASIVEGWVLDHQGRAIVGAQVGFAVEADELFSGMGFRYTALTNDDGYYQIAWEDNPSQLLSATHAGFVPHLEYVVEGMNPGQRVLHNITLDRSATVRGVVRYNGEPVEGARMSGGPYVPREPNTTGAIALRDREPVRSDASGAFVLEGIVPGARTIGATLPDSYGKLPEIQQLGTGSYRALSMLQRVDLQENGESNIEFDFETPAATETRGALATLTGVVEVVNAELRSTSDGCQYYDHVSVGVYGNEGLHRLGHSGYSLGRYTVDDLPPGPATVIAKVRLASGVTLEQSVDVEIPITGAVRQDFLFAPSSGIRGYVRGIPPGRVVHLLLLEGKYGYKELNTELPLCGRQDLRGDGQYQFPSIEPGTYTVVALQVPAVPVTSTEILSGTGSVKRNRQGDNPSRPRDRDWYPPLSYVVDSVSIAQIHRHPTPPPALAVATIKENQTIELNIDAQP